MKKILSFLLIMALIISTLSIGVVAATSNLPGDVNNDGKVNNKDLGVLMQYTNGWSTTINTKLADVNADGKINNKDSGLLMQYVNGWDVKLENKQDDIIDGPLVYW